MTELQSFSISDRGRRHNNEDFTAFYEPTDPTELEEKGCLYIVADGVGGAARGERASQFAAQKILYEYYQETAGAEPGERLRQSMLKVNQDIHSHADLNSIRMATTMVAVVIRKGFLHLANVGDSRAYLIRGGQCKQLNRDHSIVGEMVANGEMTEAEAMISKIKNHLTRSLGGEAEVHMDAYPTLRLNAGDKILLCSDGLTRYAMREDIVKLTAEGTLEEIANRLVKFANERGGADNISIVLVHYQGENIAASDMHTTKPDDFDLSTIVTKSGLQTPSLGQHRSQKRMAVMLGFITLLLLAAFGAFRSGGVLSSYPRGVPATATTAARISDRIEKATAAATITEISSASMIATVFLTVSPIVTVSTNLCLRAVESGPKLGSLAAVIASTGGRYQASQQYSRCASLDEGLNNCQALEIIETPNVVYPGWWIVVPDMDKNVCETNGGKWVTSSPLK